MRHFYAFRRVPFMTASHDMLGLPNVNGDVAFMAVNVAGRKGQVLRFSRSPAHRRDPVVRRVGGVCVGRGGSV